MSGVESQLQTGDKLFTLHQREIRPSFLFASALLCQVDKQFKLNHFLINIHVIISFILTRLICSY